MVKVVITPAISVMSAIEGLGNRRPAAWIPGIVPLSIIVLTLLFMIQKHGTAMVGKLFCADHADLVFDSGRTGVT